MDLVKVLNTIRSNASDIYRSRVPVATKKNIEDIQAVMANPNNAVVVNEFFGNLINQIAVQSIITKTYTNKLKALKKGTKPLGDTVEEVYANYVQAKGYDPTGAQLLQREIPDVKTVYHQMNRKDYYKTSVSPEMIAKAFSSYDKLETFISNIINTLYNSSELDEFVLMKQLIAQAIDSKAMKIVTVPDPLLSEANAKQFIKTVKIVSGDMEYANSNNNNWLEYQSDDNKPIITNSNKDEQILIIDNATDVSVSIDVLAYAFNMTVAEFNDTRKIVIDAFPDSNIRACLVDEQFFQVYDDLITARKVTNDEGLFDNYLLHVWQTLAFSPLVNAVAFSVGSDEDTDGDVEDFTVTYTLKEGVTSTNKRSKATEGGSYATTLKGVQAGDTVTVTMGGTNITSNVYNSQTNKINIPTVTDAIVITVA